MRQYEWGLNSSCEKYLTMKVLLFNLTHACHEVKESRLTWRLFKQKILFSKTFISEEQLPCLTHLSGIINLWLSSQIAICTCSSSSFSRILSSCDFSHELASLCTKRTLSRFLNHSYSVKPHLSWPHLCHSIFVPGAPIVVDDHSALIRYHASSYQDAALR